MTNLRALFILPLFLFASVGLAQVDPTLATGKLPYQSYQSGDIDNVNLSNGALNVRIPLLDYPQVGGKLDLGFSVVWPGKIVTFDTYCVTTGDDQICNQGWESAPDGMTNGTDTGPTIGLVDDQDVQTTTYQFIYSPQYAGFTRYYNIINFGTMDGAWHPAIDVPAQTNSLGGQRSLDGTNFFNGNRQESTYALGASGGAPCTQSCYTVGPDGIIYYGPNGIRQDANGNSIQRNTNGYIDTTGRQVPTPTVASTSASTAGCTGPLPIYAVSTWNPPGVGNTSLPYKLCYVQVAGNIPGQGSPFQVGGEYIQSIVLPTGQTWTFEYNVCPASDCSPGINFAELSKITYPTGGTVSYTYDYYYGLSSTLSLYVTSRTVNDNNSNGVGPQTWTYSYNSPQIGNQPYKGISTGGPQTVVTDPLGNVTVHTFYQQYQNAQGFEFLTQYYDHADGAIHKTVSTTYQAAPEIEDVGGTWGQALNVFPTSVTTTLDNGDSSVATKSYCPSAPSICTFNYDLIGGGGGTVSFGKLAQDEVYGSATSGQGTLLSNSTTEYQFQTSGGSSYLNGNLLNLVNSTTVSDTAQRAQTTYGYDESGLGPTGQLGNLTSVSRWLNTGGTVKSTTQFNPQGMPTLLTDPNLTQTSFSYQCGGSALSTVTKAYQSTTTMPETTTYGYDCYSGKLTNATDPNGVMTNYSYVDPANRLTLITRAAGTNAQSGTAFSYPSATQFNVAQDQNTFGDGNITSGNTYDGLGRIIQQQRPGGYMVDTTYNQVGEVASVSNPHGATAAPTTDGTSYYYYDGLGRKVKETEPDSNSLWWCYNGVQNPEYSQPSCSAMANTNAGGMSSVDATDESGRHQQQVSDALGRLIAVMEPDPLSGSLALETDHAYDALGDLTSVNQLGETGDTARTTRSFSYDSLSRLVSSFNPEVGTLSYVYDSNGNLTQKTAPNPNASSGTVTLGYWYDCLNRMVAKFYSAPPSYTGTCPGSGASLANLETYSSAVEQFTYDTPSTSGLTNTIGRLTSATTLSSGSVMSQRNGLSYDPLGRLLADQQWPYAPYPSTYQFSYSYDLAGDLLTSNNGLSNALNLAYSYDNAQRLASANAAAFGSVPATTLFQPVAVGGLPAYGAVGLNGAQLGLVSGTPAVTLARTYDKRMRLTGETDQGQVVATPGSGSTGTITITGGPVTGSRGRATLTAVVDGVTSQASGVSGFTASEFASDLAAAIQSSSDGLVNAQSSGGTITLTSTVWGSAANYSVSAATNNSVFQVSSTNMSGGTNATLQPGQVYSYNLAGQFAPNGNLTGYTDSVMGQWSFASPGYDMLNRLTNGTAISGPFAGQSLCWTYDHFGNRLQEGVSTAGCSGTQSLNSWSDYDSNNHVTSSSTGLTYAGAGNVYSDGLNTYLYDSEGRVCAAQGLYSGVTTGYVYGPTGARVAKGTVGGFTATCPTSSNLGLTNEYLLDQNDNQVSELAASVNPPDDWTPTWWHSNVFIGGGLGATYDPQGLHFHLSDWLGTRRVQVSSAGIPEENCVTLPFGNRPTGNQPPCSFVAAAPATDDNATEQQFTGKEYDSESQNDYFSARYYSPTMGRFMSPDWSAQAAPVPYASLGNPQSLNLYSYVGNNPLIRSDSSGHRYEGSDPYQGDVGSAPVDADSGRYGWLKAAAEENEAFMAAFIANADQNAAEKAQQQNNTTGYKTQDAAAKAVLTGLNPKSIKENTEYAGLIYKDANGLYHYTNPNGGNGDSSPVGSAPSGTTVYGDYHTHGDYAVPGPNGTTVRSDAAHDRYNSDHFSSTDMQQNRDSARSNSAFRGYLGTPSGALLIYNPITRQEGPLQ